MGATDSGAVDGAVKNIQSKSSGLSGSVGFKGANAPDDVWKVSSALTNNGLMEAPQRHADNALFTSITKAQENMDYSLKRDGLVNPGGPTESTYTRYVGQGFMKPPSGAVGEDKPKQLDSDGYKPLGTAGDVLKREHEQDEAEAQRARLIRQQERRQEREQADAAKRAMAAQQTPGLNSELSTPIKPETVKKAVEGLGALANRAVSALTGGATGSPLPPGEGQGEGPLRQAPQEHDAGNPLTRRFAPPSPGGRGFQIAPLSYEAYASNRRTADALGKYKGVGDLPRFTTDAINTHGEKAVHEVADLIGQVHGRDQDQAKELFDKTAQGIAPENRALLKRAMDVHIADQKAAAQPTESPDAGSPTTASRPSEQDQANALIDQVAEKIGLGKEDAQGLKDSFAKGGDDAASVKRFLWENRDAFADGRTDVAISPRPGDPGTSQDEQGNWYDKDGKPLDVPKNPLLQHVVTTPGSDHESERTAQSPDDQSTQVAQQEWRERPTNGERFMRLFTDSDQSVTQNLPPHEYPKHPPTTEQGRRDDYVNRLQLDFKYREHIQKEDFETLRLLERFRQLDGDDARELQRRMDSLRKRDPELFSALNNKRATALANPDWEIWSMSDRDLQASIDRIEGNAPAGTAMKFLNDLRGVVPEKPYGLNALANAPSMIEGISKSVRGAMGQIPVTDDPAYPYKKELLRRKNWNDQR